MPERLPRSPVRTKLANTRPTSRTGRSARTGLGLLLMLAAYAVAAPPPPSRVTVTDHGFAPAVFPRYFGREHGWLDTYNEDPQDGLWMRHELAFDGSRIPWRILQTYAGAKATPVGGLGLRFPLSGHRVTKTQPRWAGTWGRHDETFPGLLDVEVDSCGLADAPCRLTGSDGGDVGSIQAVWEHPDADITAMFLMLPDDDRLFVEIGVRPRRETESIAVVLRCWPRGDFVMRTRSGTSPPLGYGQPYPFPADQATVLFTDPEADPKGKAFEGTCALTYMPQECSAAEATRTFPLFVKLQLPPPPAGGTVYSHIVLWELMQRRGDEAWDYLTSREEDTLSQFTRIHHFRAPALAATRNDNLERARGQLANLDQQLNESPQPGTRPEYGSGYWRMSEDSLTRHWVRFHCAEAERALSRGDWQEASDSLDQAARHLESLK